MNEMQHIGIIGAGVMGRGIVQVCAAAGYQVHVYDVAQAQARAGAEFAAGMLRRAGSKGQMPPEAAESAVARIQVCENLSSLRDADLVIEAAAEDLQIKQQLFAQLEEVVADHAILASNTSSLLITELASRCRRPQRVAGLHFFNPVPLMKLVEVIPGLRTDGSVVDALVALVRRIGHNHVLASDSPGFLVNHAGRAFYTEGVRIVSEGVAQVQDVDRVARDALGFRLGPFELFDHTGLDVSYPVLTKIYHQFFEEARFRPHPLLTRQVAGGQFGKKTGRGFYAYKDGVRVEEPEAAFTNGEERAVWIADRGEDGRRLHDRLTELGIAVDTGATPGASSILLLTPWGCDATTQAARQGLPLAQCMAIDMLVWPVQRLTIMPTVGTTPGVRDSLRGMLSRRGVSVTCLHDSGGFIAQRLLASIVNLACEIAQQRIGRPADIERAVQLGLGYPKGPLQWGTDIGAPRVLEIVQSLYDFYGDARYRPSPWLRRRALAGLPLLTPDP